MLHNQLSKSSLIPQSQSVLYEVRDGEYDDNRPIPQDLIEKCLELEGMVKDIPHLTIDDSHSDHGLSYSISRVRDRNRKNETQNDEWKFYMILEVFPRISNRGRTITPGVEFLIRDCRWMTEFDITPVREVIQDTCTFDLVNGSDGKQTTGTFISPRTGREWYMSNCYRILDIRDLDRLLKTIPE